MRELSQDAERAIERLANEPTFAMKLAKKFIAARERVKGEPKTEAEKVLVETLKD
jgi:hypothetical protein